MKPSLRDGWTVTDPSYMQQCPGEGQTKKGAEDD